MDSRPLLFSLENKWDKLEGKLDFMPTRNNLVLGKSLRSKKAINV